MDAYEADFPAIREQVLETFRQLAADSARRLAATGQPVPPAFEEAVVDEVVASLPTPEVLRERLMLQYRVGVMQLGSELWAEARLAADERRRTQEIESEARLARERTAVAERLVQEQLWSEQERLRRQREAEEQERQREAAIKERLRQLKLEAARDRLQEALSPLEEGARQLHAAVYEAASAIRSSLQKHQALRGPSARKVRELCRWYSMMNWQDARANLIQALLGLTVTEMENVLAKAAVRDRGFGPNTGRLVLDEKRDLIRKTAALTFTPPIPIEHVGGYQPIRRLLRLAALTFSPEARGLICPRASAPPAGPRGSHGRGRRPARLGGAVHQASAPDRHHRQVRPASVRI